jgi:DNA-binding MarR family transcriptional regulator
MTDRPSRAKKPAPENAKRRVLDLDRYTVAYLVWTANKLSRGASHNYLKVFGVGVEIWRCLVLLAIHNSIAAQQVSQVMGMDKASVSRCFKIMQARGLILMGLDASDGRVRLATLTPKGRALHDEILEMALERERAVLSVLSESERATLLRLLKRVHENMAAVELATASYIAKRYPRAARRRLRAVDDATDRVGNRGMTGRLRRAVASS